jgi:hypothetical protein
MQDKNLEDGIENIILAVVIANNRDGVIDPTSGRISYFINIKNYKDFSSIISNYLCKLIFNHCQKKCTKEDIINFQTKLISCIEEGSAIDKSNQNLDEYIELADLYITHFRVAISLAKIVNDIAISNNKMDDIKKILPLDQELFLYFLNEFTNNPDKTSKYETKKYYKSEYKLLHDILYSDIKSNENLSSKKCLGKKQYSTDYSTRKRKKDIIKQDERENIKISEYIQLSSNQCCHCSIS